MPELNSDAFNFDDAPGGGASLDDIFSFDGEPSAASTPVTPTPQDTVVTDPEPLLKTSTGSVYNTVDDAVKGIEHKDALIAQLRQQVLEATKVDPLKKQSDVEDPRLVSYIENPAKYFADIKAAKDEKTLLEVQARFVDERFAPYARIAASVVKSQAIESVVSEVPKFREFLASDDYKATLDSFPLLKQSIEISENYAERSGDLPQLYRMAFDASAGRNLPKYVQASGSTTPVPRPTVTSTAVAPPPSNTKAAPPSFDSTEGRKAIIEQQVASGVENLRF